MEEKKKNENNIGGLWKKVSQNGKSYLSGSILYNGERIYFSVFPNTYKETEKQPDYTILKSNYAAPKDEFIDKMDSEIGKDANKNAKINPQTGEIDEKLDDDIPF